MLVRFEEGRRLARSSDACDVQPVHARSTSAHHVHPSQSGTCGDGGELEPRTQSFFLLRRSMLVVRGPFGQAFVYLRVGVRAWQRLRLPRRFVRTQVWRRKALLRRPYRRFWSQLVVQRLLAPRAHTHHVSWCTCWCLLARCDLN